MRVEADSCQHSKEKGKFVSLHTHSMAGGTIEPRFVILEEEWSGEKVRTTEKQEISRGHRASVIVGAMGNGGESLQIVLCKFNMRIAKPPPSFLLFSYSSIQLQ